MSTAAKVLCILLLVALAFDGVLCWAFLRARDAAVTSAAQAADATADARACTAGVARLEQQAAQRQQAAEKAMTAAAGVAQTHAQRAEQIQATPPAMPGDACASAAARVDAWWAARADGAGGVK